jgi:formate hydrogenlyase subunit 3/multisubunit Na+/H+ antiporter MnhD subunit
LQGGWVVAPALALALLLVAFGGMLRALHRMAYAPGGPARPLEPVTWQGVAPIAVALVLLLLTGLAWPPGLDNALVRIAAVAGS